MKRIIDNEGIDIERLDELKNNMYFPKTNIEFEGERFNITHVIEINNNSNDCGVEPVKTGIGMINEIFRMGYNWKMASYKGKGKEGWCIFSCGKEDFLAPTCIEAVAKARRWVIEQEGK